MTKPVPSPCISVCLLDEKDMCVGCYRTAVEITEWMECDNEARFRILHNCAERRKAEQMQIFK